MGFNCKCTCYKAGHVLQGVPLIQYGYTCASYCSNFLCLIPNFSNKLLRRCLAGAGPIPVNLPPSLGVSGTVVATNCAPRDTPMLLVVDPQYESVSEGQESLSEGQESVSEGQESEGQESEMHELDEQEQEGIDS